MKRTITDLAHRRAMAEPDAPAYYVPEGDGYRSLSQGEVAAAAEALSLGLWALGLRPGDRVAVVSETRYEWGLADRAVLAFGGVVVAVYPTSTPAQVAYLLDHSGAKAVVLENGAQWARLEGVLAELPGVAHVLLIDSDAPPGAWQALTAVQKSGRALAAAEPGLAAANREGVRPGDLATLVYTSGTTGRPKGVALTHENLYAVAEAVRDVLPLQPGDRGVTYLPMAHILERVSGYVGLMAEMIGYFAPAMTAVMETCRVAEPVTLAGVPRVFEKVHAGVLAQVARSPARRQRLFARALAAGGAAAARREAGEALPWTLRARAAIYERLVFRPLRTGLFGPNIRWLTSGAAPLSAATLEFFTAIGLPIHEGYGLTETSSPITLNTPADHRRGTVGRPLPGAAVRVAADGEIELRGPGVCGGYYRDPARTAEAFTADGWFRSGDIGTLDEDGFLTITDRKKNLLITAAGKNIAPAPIENRLVRHPLVAQAIVLGDGQPYLTALLALDEPALAARGMTAGAVEAELDAHVTAVNAGLARYETIKAFRVAPEALSVAAGTLTPTLKVKRAVVVERYGDLIAGMYEG